MHSCCAQARCVTDIYHFLEFLLPTIKSINSKLHFIAIFIVLHHYGWQTANNVVYKCRNCHLWHKSAQRKKMTRSKPRVTMVMKWNWNWNKIIIFGMCLCLAYRWQSLQIYLFIYFAFISAVTSRERHSTITINQMGVFNQPVYRHFRQVQAQAQTRAWACTQQVMRHTVCE